MTRQVLKVMGKENKRVGEEKSVTQRWDICLLPQVLGGRKDRSGIPNPTWSSVWIQPIPLFSPTPDRTSRGSGGISGGEKTSAQRRTSTWVGMHCWTTFQGREESPEVRRVDAASGKVDTFTGCPSIQDNKKVVTLRRT